MRRPAGTRDQTATRASKSELGASPILVGGGMMLLAIAPCMGLVDLPAWLASASALALCASVASFACALIVGAASGRRGTAKGSGALSVAVFVANLAGVALSLGSVAALGWGAAVHWAVLAR